jgi:major vault protein
MIYGPQSYLPPVEVEVIREVQQIPLDKNEGIYVRNTKTGQCKEVIGQNYMLKPDEERYSLQLPALTRQLLEKDAKFNPDKLITYNCPFNACVQVFNFYNKTSRIVWGPRLVKLLPNETITVNVLSGGKPKTPGRIQSLHVDLGPDFTTDLVEVETSDHCRLNILLSYNWFFDVERGNEEAYQKVFAIKDFIGDLCTLCASLIRSTVAGIQFEQFHEASAKIIRTCIFGVDENGKIRDKYKIKSNNMTITNIDIKDITPIDKQTRDALQNTVSLSIEYTNKMQEDKAIREFETEKVKAEGELVRTKLKFNTSSKKEEINLQKFKAESASVLEEGKANANAKANAQYKLVMAESKRE